MFILLVTQTHFDQFCYFTKLRPATKALSILVSEFAVEFTPVTKGCVTERVLFSSEILKVLQLKQFEDLGAMMEVLDCTTEMSRLRTSHE